MKVSTDIMLAVEVEGRHSPGVRARATADGTWLPGEGECIEDMRVFLVQGGKRLDITALVADDKLRDIEEDALELCALNY